MNPFASRMRSTCAALLLTSLASVTWASESRGPDATRREPVNMTFRFDAAELATPEGARRAYRRLRIAARRHCTSPGTPLADLQRHDRQCAADLIEKVVSRVGSPQLTARHRGAITAEVAARR